MNREEQERLYREAMRARREGERCPICSTHHSALSACPVPTPDEARAATAAAGVPPLVRTSDVETSHAAAASGDKRALRFACLALYANAGEDGLVDDDLAIWAGFPDGHESYRRRGSDLRALGWTEWLMEKDASGYSAHPQETPVRRATSLGASARVSVITPLGRAVWETHNTPVAS